MALRALLAGVLCAGVVHLTAAPVDACQQRGAAVVSAAADYIGVREATGRNDGPMVEYFQALTRTGRGDAWCGSFVYAVHVEAGVLLPGGGRAYAWSPTWHPVERQVWTKRRGLNHRFQGRGSRQPMPGDVGGLYYSNLGRYGHVFVIEKWAEQTTITIEGNTNGEGSREGDGVYRKRRRTNMIDVVSRWVC